MSSIYADMSYGSKYNLYNKQQINTFNQQTSNKDFLITQCDGNTKLTGSADLDYYFNEDSVYKFPKLVICDDSKRINVNADVYQKYSDVIVDECGNRFNIRNLRDSAGILQKGYSANIDLDSHLKNINYYNDKCFYDNWKLSPKSNLPACNGLKRNSNIIVPDYTPVGKHYEDCIGSGACASNTSVSNTSSTCINTPPTDINCETDIRKRYNFNHNSFKNESCIKPADFVSFKRATMPESNNLNKYPNIPDSPNTVRNTELLKTINAGVEHEYYKFFESTKCVAYPAERLFNNNTSRKATPNHHNLYNIAPVYLA